MDFNHLIYRKVSTLMIALSALCLSLATPVSLGGDAAPVDDSVQHLISQVAGADLIFVRNSREYSGEDAAQHMRKKYAHFRDAIDTAEDFIELCASRSLLTGKPYQVINEKGETLSSKEWLTAELALYRKHRSTRLSE